MKNKIIVFIVLIFAIVAAWGIAVIGASNSKSRINKIKAQIQSNEDLGIYKKNLSLYQELIEKDKKNIEWYVKLADDYLNLKQYGNFEKTCNAMITAFPKDITGYLKLAKYYSKDNRNDKVFEVYNRLPEELVGNEDFAGIYKQSEYKYQYQSASYEEAGTFSSNYAVVKYKGYYGYVNNNAELVIKASFTTARPFLGDESAAETGEDIAAVCKDDEWYFIDREGDKISATTDDVEDLYSISEGYAAAKIDGKYGFVDKDFKKVNFEYDFATNFYNGVAGVKVDGKWMLINKKFEELTEPIYDDLVIDDTNVCSRKKVIFAKKDDVYYMLNEKGEEITSETFEDAHMFQSDEPAAVKSDGKWGFINTDGEMVIDFEYEDAGSFNLGIAPVLVKNKWGFINSNGELVIANDFDGAQTFYSSGITSVKVGKHYRFIQLMKYKKH